MAEIMYSTPKALHHRAQGCERSELPWVNGHTIIPKYPNGVSSIMPQSLANILVHIVFSTKNREPFLTDADLRDEMHRMLGESRGTWNVRRCWWAARPITFTCLHGKRAPFRWPIGCKN
jgi:hypothetical protein